VHDWGKFIIYIYLENSKFYRNTVIRSVGAYEAMHVGCVKVVSSTLFSTVDLC
jgi:hypothetical protein